MFNISQEIKKRNYILKLSKSPRTEKVVSRTRRLVDVMCFCEPEDILH